MTITENKGLRLDLDSEASGAFSFLIFSGSTNTFLGTPAASATTIPSHKQFPAFPQLVGRGPHRVKS